MDHFTYKNNRLNAENVPIEKIAEKVGTPFYCYSKATLTRHYEVFSAAFSKVKTTICFAVKCNSNVAVLKTLGDLGAGADTVSEGEIRRALAAGIKPSKIVFSGVGKTRDEMRFALKKKIGQFNVESREELAMLGEEAAKLNKKAPVAIRVNPDVDAKTHNKISTGRKGDKFGVDWEDIQDVYALAAKNKNIEIVGVATHIGSQLTSLAPFRSAFEKLAGLVVDLRGKGHSIRRLDLGGGLGIPYKNETPPSPADYADMIVKTVKHLGCELVLEPGRLIAGNAGILVTKVALVKKTKHKNFVVVDAAMNDLIRPSLYDAYHEIVTVKKSKNEISADVVGPVCETADIFGAERNLPDVKEEDLLVIRSAGAYGAVMSSSYNSRPLIAEVMVSGSKFAAIRPRQTYAQILSSDKIPDWL